MNGANPNNEMNGNTQNTNINTGVVPNNTNSQNTGVYPTNSVNQVNSATIGNTSSGNISK